MHCDEILLQTQYLLLWWQWCTAKLAPFANNTCLNLCAKESKQKTSFTFIALLYITEGFWHLANVLSCVVTFSQLFLFSIFDSYISEASKPIWILENYFEANIWREMYFHENCLYKICFWRWYCINWIVFELKIASCGFFFLYLIHELKTVISLALQKQKQL